MKSLKILIIVYAGLSIIIAQLQAVPLAIVPWTLFEESSGQSFMFVKPVYMNLAMQQSLWHDIIYNKPNKSGGSFQITGLFQQTRSDDAIARYFLINHQNSLMVAGDDTAAGTIAMRDVRAEWLNLPSNFMGNVGIDPFQRQFGFMVEYLQDFTFLNLPFFENYWVSLTLPFVSVHNRLNVEQSGIVNPTPDVAIPQDLIQAFNQAAWLYGKFPECRSNGGLAEIALRFGKAYMNEDCYQIAYYSLFKIPAHEGQDAAYLFDAVVGNNGHWGFGAGVNFQLVLNKDTSCAAYCWFLNIENTFLFKDHQYRTFDLRDKPWSRYMLFTRQGGEINQIVPGVNILTREVRVHPYNMADISTGIRYKTSMIEAEIGYSLYLRGDERLELEDHATIDVFAIMGSGPGISASASTIDTLAADDMIANPNPATPGLIPTFIPIDDTQIDLNSAATQAALVHKAHISFGATHKSKLCDYIIGIGLDFEIPQGQFNTALKTIAFWTKVGASF